MKRLPDPLCVTSLEEWLLATEPFEVSMPVDEPPPVVAGVRIIATVAAPPGEAMFVQGGRVVGRITGYGRT